MASYDSSRTMSLLDQWMPQHRPWSLWSLWSLGQVSAMARWKGSPSIAGMPQATSIPGGSYWILSTHQLWCHPDQLKTCWKSKGRLKKKTSCNDTPHSVQFGTRENKCHRQHTLSPIPTSSHQDHLFDVGPNPLESLVGEYVPTELQTRNLAQHDM